MKKRFQTLISAKDAYDASLENEIVIFDCRFYLNDPARGRKEYLQSHIPNAVYLDTNLDLSSPVIKGITGRHPLPHPEVIASTFQAGGLSNKSQVIAYDQSNGAHASRAWWLLRWLGHDDVAVLDGGFQAWLSAGYPVDNQWPIPQSGKFESHIRQNFTIQMGELNAMNASLIDSREYKRYTGEYEPIDPVAGHIPGAVCIPYMENTNENGMWKPADELRSRFSEIETNKNEAPVFYCGSGVTACHNILAYKIATGKDARLYPGSWSEWINYHKVEDPNSKLQDPNKMQNPKSQIKNQNRKS